MKNAFGYDIPPIKDIITDSNVKEAISLMLTDVLDYLGVPSSDSPGLVHQCIDAASSYQSLEAYEAQAHNIMDAKKVTQRIPEKLSVRAGLMYRQIEPYLLEGGLLDYGCGDGQVSELVAKNLHRNVSLTDVYMHRHIPETGLPFKLFRQGEKAPFSGGEFSNVLALTVFHHSSNPAESIKDVSGLVKAGGRVLVVESVYGVDGNQLPPEMQKKIWRYVDLSAEQQRLLNVFFDHFYNRILSFSPHPETKVNVPFNFNTPDNWKRIFAQNSLKQEEVVHLGLDQPLVPEYHTLHILRKQL
jgi:SAM-dependent methyltransferase